MNAEDRQSRVNRVGSTAQRLAEKPYEKRVCRIECYPSCVQPGESVVVPAVSLHEVLLVDYRD